MNSLVAKFEKDVTLFEQYSKVIQDYLDKGFVEYVDLDDKSGCFLPHHPVFKESATTPLRVVFNASSRPASGGRSLNDCLYTGPSLTLRLHDTLLRFRQNPFVVISDISKAFHRILIHPEHRRYTKFLYVDTERRRLCLQFKVVIFGASSSPYLLQQVLDTHLSSPQLPICDLASQFYVDDFFKTYNDEEDAIREKPIIDDIMKDASMPLQAWISNSSKFN